MAITYGYFNSLNGDRKYNADQMSEYFDGLVSDGVYESVGGGLQVLANEGMTVSVQSGRGLIDCKWLKNDAVLNIDITQAHVTLNRYSAVILKLDRINRLMEITTKDGTPASNPTKPEMTSDSSTKELCLAYIYVGAGVTEITQANIEDTRPSSACGWVTGLVEQVDTSTLFLQYQTAYENYYETMTAEFEQWFDTLTSQLNVNTYIRKFEKNVTIATKGEDILLNMTNYTYDSADVIYVFVNGLFAEKETDWTLDTTGATAVINLDNVEAGATINIEVLKSKIGFNTVLTSNGLLGGSDGSTVIIGEGA